MRQSARSPNACQKVIWRQPKSGGRSQFHNSITISPPRKANSAIPTIAAGTIQINRLTFGLIFSSSSFREIVVNFSQALAQAQHGIVFAREQRVYAHAGLRGHLLEAAPLQFVSDEYFTL